MGCTPCESDLSAGDMNDEDVDAEKTQPDDDCMNHFDVILRLVSVSSREQRGH